jgi:hypothetical protein
LTVDLPDLNAGLEMMARLAVSPVQPACLDLEPPGRLWLRLAGLPESLRQRVARLRNLDGVWTQIAAHDEEQIWRDVREFAWVPHDHGLVKIALVPGKIPALERALSSLAAPIPRRYSVGGNVAWTAWPKELSAQCLEERLQGLALPAVPLTGVWPATLLGRHPGQGFAQRLLRVFDPQGKFQRGRTS